MITNFLHMVAIFLGAFFICSLFGFLVMALIDFYKTKREKRRKKKSAESRKIKMEIMEELTAGLMAATTEEEKELYKHWIKELSNEEF